MAGARASALGQRGVMARSVLLPPLSDPRAGEVAGRTVASRVGTGAAWRCVSYDARGRPTSRSVPPTVPARTVSYNWAVGNNPLVNAVSDPV